MSDAERVAERLRGRQRSRAPRLACNAQAMRRGLGLTVDQVAAALDVGRGTVANAEAGYSVRLDTALALARFYGRTLDDLWPAGRGGA